MPRTAASLEGASYAARGPSISTGIQTEPETSCFQRPEPGCPSCPGMHTAHPHLCLPTHTSVYLSGRWSATHTRKPLPGPVVVMCPATCSLACES